MAMLSIVAYDPPGTSRHAMLDKCLDSIVRTVNVVNKHELIIVSNGITQDTRQVIEAYAEDVSLDFIDGSENIGTARGQNKAWVKRKPGQSVCKVDPDMVMHEPGWLDKLEECVARESKIGLIGLKRKDLAESPHNPPGQWSHSKLIMLPHQAGETWLIVEEVGHVIGSCCLHSSALLDKVGYLWQPGLYGWDDGDMNCRSHVAGFMNCFYSHFAVDHIDPGGCPFTQWKHVHAGKDMELFLATRRQYAAGNLPLWRGPE